MHFFKYVAGIIFLLTAISLSVNLLFATGQSSKKDDIHSVKQSNNIFNMSKTLGSINTPQVASTNTVLATQVNSLQKQVNILSQVVNDLKLHIDQTNNNQQRSIDDGYGASALEGIEHKVAEQQWKDFNSDNENFIHQSDDFSWAAMKEDALRNNISGQSKLLPLDSKPLPTDILEGLECRSTSCRLDVMATKGLDAMIEKIMLKSLGVFTNTNVHYSDAGDAIIFFSNE